MTRETKIGLLVGLAFIIVIGILLSDHLTSSTEPPAASIAATAQSMRLAMQTPGGTPQSYSPVVAPQQVRPSQPVPITRDVRPLTPTADIVKIGGPSINGGQQAPANPDPSKQVASQLGGQAPDEQQVVKVDPTPATALEHVARSHGEALVSTAPESSSQQHPQTVGGSAGSNFKDYPAQSGDTVSGMAMKFFGNRNKASLDAIIRANPSLQQDPNRVVQGKVYRIPVVVDSATTATPAPATATPSGTTRRELVSATENLYTVKPGDSLWRIAQDQLGDPESRDAIRELNKDKIGPNDTIQAGAVLRLPGKPIARAN